ncbi:helix-turn-helix domain-containing protein [Terrabacter sp. GCM10028922]|uniref:helix-turn-helix domain-containing protein n=1 Tax=Terrabacter sp. GCM10028922 TaxID=3273428 RepID=UPI00361ED67B
MNLDELLGIDPHDPSAILADELVESHYKLLKDLVDVRRQRGLTQAQVADRMGISQGAVARIEHGDRDPHLSTLRRYAHAVRAMISHTVAPFDRNREVVVDHLADDPYEAWAQASVVLVGSRGRG